MFASPPPSSQDSAAGPFEPDRAMRTGVNGAAVIECKVAQDRTLNGCAVTSETPPDFGFGAAALAMAHSRTIHAPALADGAPPPADAPLRFTVPFTLAWVALFERGGDQWEAGNLPGAIDDYTAAIKLAPDYHFALVDRGAVYDALGQYDRALEDENHAIRNSMPDPDAYTDRGFIYLHTGKLKPAAADFDQAIKLAPNDDQAFLGRALASFQGGDYGSAIQDFDHVTAIDPHSEPALQYRCLARAITGQALDQALTDCNAALALQPNSAKVLEIRGIVQYRLGRYDQAAADATAALTRKPGIARALYVRSLAERRLGQGGGADADLAAATAIDANIVRTAGFTP